MHERPVGRGYVNLEETADFPWAGRAAERATVRAHEFHYSSIENLPICATRIRSSAAMVSTDAVTASS